ncbi:polymorphic toxin-type HINT domain-containing protein [Halothiobacillus diazotrophicus]|uniref:polymorphic toxin-type HINT domain-containing protein n=1 Tax=Halothiobacillus diazotrophicus TaxID=1860122 RepID=UPI0009ECE723|nr:polymorphic toxin-type HINT domain-containing protein [Halothiobacillus diazotrophicus]
MINFTLTPIVPLQRAFDRADDIKILEEGQQPCFAAATLVHTKKGLRPIEEICVGDWVLSYPDDQQPPDKFREGHEYTYRQVTQTFVTENQPISKLIVAEIVNNRRETIYVTPNHPIYRKYSGWVPVSEFEPGDVVENYQFRNLMVARVFHAVDFATVYNLEVDEFHTYYVGEEGIWVHNKCEVESSNWARSNWGQNYRPLSFEISSGKQVRLCQD